MHKKSPTVETAGLPKLKQIKNTHDYPLTSTL